MTTHWGTFSALNAQANPPVLMVGDSWFWYPIDNLAVELGAALPNTDLLAVGRSGAEAADWATKARKDIDFAFKMYAAGAQALILSGGGNDFAGSADFLKIVRDDCSKAKSVDDCWRPGQPAALAVGVAAACEGVMRKLRAYNPHGVVVLHNYDHAWPTGKGFFGPADWLKAPMDRSRVPQGLRRALLMALLARLHQAHVDLASKPDLGSVIALPTAGTMPVDDANVRDWWANELHPTPRGFKLIAKKHFVPALRKIGLN